MSYGSPQVTEVTDDKGYTGQEMLDPLELVHLNGRVYDPLMGKFLSGDPLVADPNNGQNYNRYSYVLNNPTNLEDPTGFAVVSHEKNQFGMCTGANRCYDPTNSGVLYHEDDNSNNGSSGASDSGTKKDSQGNAKTDPKKGGNDQANGGTGSGSGQSDSGKAANNVVPGSNMVAGVGTAGVADAWRAASAAGSGESWLGRALGGSFEGTEVSPYGLLAIPIVGLPPSAEAQCQDTMCGVQSRVQSDQGNLAKNIEIARSEVRQQGEDAHHIVAVNDPRAAVSRAVLTKYGFNINDALNGVLLDSSYHAGLHTNAYYRNIDTILAPAKSAEDVTARLTDIRGMLETQTFPH